MSYYFGAAVGQFGMIARVVHAGSPAEAAEIIRRWGENEIPGSAWGEPRILPLGPAMDEASGGLLCAQIEACVSSHRPVEDFLALLGSAAPGPPADEATVDAPGTHLHGMTRAELLNELRSAAGELREWARERVQADERCSPSAGAFQQDTATLLDVARAVLANVAKVAPGVHVSSPSACPHPISKACTGPGCEPGCGACGTHFGGLAHRAEGGLHYDGGTKPYPCEPGCETCLALCLGWAPGKDWPAAQIAALTGPPAKAHEISEQWKARATAAEAALAKVGPGVDVAALRVLAEDFQRRAEMVRDPGAWSAAASDLRAVLASAAPAPPAKLEPGPHEPVSAAPGVAEIGFLMERAVVMPPISTATSSTFGPADPWQRAGNTWEKAHDLADGAVRIELMGAAECVLRRDAAAFRAVIEEAIRAAKASNQWYRSVHPYAAAMGERDLAEETPLARALLDCRAAGRDLP